MARKTSEGVPRKRESMTRKELIALCAELDRQLALEKEGREKDGAAKLTKENDALKGEVRLLVTRLENVLENQDEAHRRDEVLTGLLASSQETSAVLAALILSLTDINNNQAVAEFFGIAKLMGLPMENLGDFPINALTRGARFALEHAMRTNGVSNDEIVTTLVFKRVQ